MNPKLPSALFVLALAASIAGCGKTTAPATDPAGTKAVPPASAAAAAPQGQAPAELSGTIVETMDAGGYTYLKLKTASGEVWAAANQTPVKVGDTATVFGAMPMDGFESPSLKRKFDRIYFGSLAPAGTTPPAAGKDAAAPAGPSAVPADAAGVVAAAHGNAKKDEVDAGPIKVDKASGADGKTVAEVFAQRTSLKGKPVAVRGKVVKFLPGIMGKNWVHIQDGTGAKAKKDHDLTITTQETVAVGSIVLVRGKLDVDKDVGSGYEFQAIIEDAKFTK